MENDERIEEAEVAFKKYLEEMGLRIQNKLKESLEIFKEDTLESLQSQVTLYTSNATKDHTDLKSHIQKHII